MQISSNYSMNGVPYENRRRQNDIPFYLNCIIIIRLSLQKLVFSPDNPVVLLIQNSYHSLRDVYKRQQ